MTELLPGPRCGAVEAPRSKSHEHRLLIADFLAGDCTRLSANPADNADIIATKRCLLALADETATPVLDCGESGSTLRFLAPVAAALGKRPEFRRAGRLAERPFTAYDVLTPGVHELAGNVSSQFVTGLLFALPLLAGDSEIRFTTPLESRGYVDMTLQVIRRAGIEVSETPMGFHVSGRQTYRACPTACVEGDWSGAAFWLAMNARGSDVRVTGLQADSAQPDRMIAGLLANFPRVIDVSQCPDIFPVLTIVAATQAGETHFTGIQRLRLKESDRVAAMADVLTRFGVAARVRAEAFDVSGTTGPLGGGFFKTFGDHRVAMAVAVGATCAKTPVLLDDSACCAKSYPGFFDLFAALHTSKNEK